jgi:hypothetical protein
MEMLLMGLKTLIDSSNRAMDNSHVNTDLEKASQKKELRIQRQIAFASGLFQGDVKIQLQ